MTEKLVIIGNGMAPGRMLEHLLEAAPGRYQVTIFNAEPRVNYDRIMLSPVLSGEKDYEQIIIHGDGWYVRNGITLYKGHRIEAIDRAAKTVTSSGGVTESYDRLVIATGSNPLIIPVPGHDFAGVLTYRDLDDVNAMLLAAQSRAKAVVIGGGLLGLEAAAGLQSQGMDVTVVHLMPTLMERQLDPAAGYLLQKALEERGIKVLTSGQHQGDPGQRQGRGRRTRRRKDHSRATLVVMAAGIRPNVALAREAGLAIGRGIVVDHAMRTSDPDILALGECAEVGGHVYGLVAPLYEMARTAAAHLAGDEAARFVHIDTPTKLKVTGIDVYSTGDFADGDDREEIVLRDASAGVYKRLILKDDRIIGTVLFGEVGDGAWFNDLKKKSANISEMRDTLIYGPAFQGGGTADPAAAVAALPDDAEICGCNGICKGKITGTIKAKGLTTLDEVRAHTKASASCGTCTGLVEQLMELTLGDAFNRSAVQPMCACTTLGHDDVRRLIVAKSLKTVPAVMQELEWKTSCGCAKCRPALNYYLVCDWPDEYADDYQSRFINERAHANIQKDGTFSVVPRMWGGVTSSTELRAIADVVDKFAIPTVKVTGGQRIDMLGVRKEDLPAGMGRSRQGGFRLGPRLRQGAAHGEDLCRHRLVPIRHAGLDRPRRPDREVHVGLLDAGQGQDGRLGVPENCAEATCKDVGVICVDSGYEIHFAGAAGLDIKGTEILGQVKTRGRGARAHCGAGPDVSRAGPLSRAHLQMGQAHRPR